MNKRIVYILLLLIFTGSCTFSYAQGVYVKAGIDRNKILIGEPIQLVLEATIPLQSGIKWFATDSIPHFEFIESGKIDSTTRGDNLSCRQTITITSFDSGRWVIPAFSLEWQGRSYVTDSIPVSVAFSNFDPNQDYHDIKDIVEVENPATRFINWILAGITLVSLVAFIYFLRKSRIAVTTVKAGKLVAGAYEEAMKALKDLQTRNLPEKGEVKLYYTLLSGIMRKFMAEKFGWRTMEKTSSELLVQLKDANLSHESLLALAQAFRMGDAVKFARYVPEAADNEISLATIRSSIQLLNNIDNRAV